MSVRHHRFSTNLLLVLGILSGVGKLGQLKS